jgi:hypothetical protein
MDKLRRISGISHNILQDILKENDERVTQLRESFKFPSLSLSDLFFTGSFDLTTYRNTIALYRDILVLPFDLEKTKQYGVEVPYLYYLIFQARRIPY